MLENQQNKMQKRDTIKDEEIETPTQEYFFPNHSITIKAHSMPEALKKLDIEIEKIENINKPNNTINK